MRSCSRSGCPFLAGQGFEWEGVFGDRDSFCLFCIETYVVAPHLGHLAREVQMGGHSMWFW